MPRGPQLSEREKQRMMDLRSCGKTQRQIASRINRSQGVVKNFLKLGIKNYDINKRPERPTRFSSTMKRAVLREVSKIRAPSFKIVSRFNLQCDSSLVRKWIVASAKLKYRKCLNSRNGAVMVWAAFKRNIKSELSFISGRLNSTDYQNMLHSHLLPFITIIDDNKVIFQQDNALIHTASSIRKWFEGFGIKLLPWRAISPHLNSIENLWSILARKVYDQEKPQIQNVRELKNGIESAWADIPNDILNRLLDNICDRLLDVIKEKRKYTN
ncbi:Transposable element Tc3 transposase, partial [Anthophora quadrimaculata]